MLLRRSERADQVSVEVFGRAGFTQWHVGGQDASVTERPLWGRAIWGGELPLLAGNRRSASDSGDFGSTSGLDPKATITNGSFTVTPSWPAYTFQVRKVSLRPLQ
jgi:hypothetical protein